MRTILILAALALLGGCNVVVTKAPLFTTADEAGAPPMRPGVWRGDADPDCKVDEARPIAEWPECAGGSVIGQGEAAYHEKGAAAGVLTREPFVFAAGDPRIVQARLKLSGDIKLAGESPPNLYIYVAARATRSDAQGRVVAVAAWLVQCGPPNTGGSDGDATLHPLPGMEMKPGEPLCVAGSPGAVRVAAKASEAWSPQKLAAHWVRDGAS